MSLKRGQVVFHNFPLPGLKETEEHPVIIISNQTVCTECDMYVGLMITSSDVYLKDEFTYELTDKMFAQKKLRKDQNYVRLHLIAYFHSKTLYKPDIVAEIKPEFIENILEEQRNKVFDEDY